MSDRDGRPETVAAPDHPDQPTAAASDRAILAADVAPADDGDADEAPDAANRRSELAPVRRGRTAALVERLPALRSLLRLLGPASTAPRRYTGTDLTPRRLARGFSRRTRALALARLRRLPCFDADDYLAAYRDIAPAGVDPMVHALFIGGLEERRLFRRETLARSLATLQAKPAGRPAVPHPSPPLGVYVSSLGNIFMHEIAEDVAACLRAAGAAVQLLDEHAPIERRPPVCLYVAPHEFFLLGRGIEWVRDAVISGGVMLNTEQAQTRWFARGLPFLLAGRGMIDLCPQTTALFAAAGVPSLHLSPAPHLVGGALTEADRLHPLFRVLPPAAKAPPDPGTPIAARPIDLAFFGSESRHREEWLARHAGALAGLESVLHYRREDRGPIRPGTPDGALTRLAQHVGGHAKIVLNLHRDAFGYLEWHRIVRLGLATGAVVVSEPCLPHPLLTPGVHYLEAPGRQIPALLAWLLDSDEGRRAAAQVQANARALLAEVVTPVATGAALLGFMHAHASPA